MTPQKQTSNVTRRRLLRRGAIVGGGLIAGGTAASGSASATDGEGQLIYGYVSTPSYDKFVGNEDVACSPFDPGWGGTFYIKREAVDRQGRPGVWLETPPLCGDTGPVRRFRAFLITAEHGTECTGGPDPDGDGPWNEDCCSWLFVDETLGVRLDVGAEFRHRPLEWPQVPCQENVQPRNQNGEDIGAEIDLSLIGFVPLP